MLRVSMSLKFLTEMMVGDSDHNSWPAPSRLSITGRVFDVFVCLRQFKETRAQFKLRPEVLFGTRRFLVQLIRARQARITEPRDLRRPQ